MRAWTTLRALMGHWRRHPVECLTLLAGLAVATALWSGVQALNAEARASYARSAALLGTGTLASVVAEDGGRFAREDFVALRLLGWPVTPLLDGRLTRDGESLRIIGIDPITLPASASALRIGEGDERLTDFLLPPHLALAAPETLARLGAPSDLPPLAASETLPPDTLVVDIGVAERLLDAEGRVSRLLLPPERAGEPLPAPLAARLRILPEDAESDLDRLTASFHLNLAAFGFLAFVVGLFIVYSAIGLAFEQRKPMIRTLRACGVSARLLTGVMLAETVGFALAGGALGIVAGYGIAAALLPDVAASLEGLYGATLPGRLSLDPAWWLAGMALCLAGALAAAGGSLWRAARLPVLAPAQPQAWLADQRRGMRRQLAAAALIAAGSLAALAFGSGLAAGFAVLGGLLVSAALALPALLASALAAGHRRARRPVAEWAWADGRQQLSGLSLALMALLLALAVNLGVGTMVESFRRTFVAYLDQRLISDLYVTGQDSAQARDIAAWAAARPEVAAVLPIWRAESRFRGWPLEIYGFADHATYRDNWPLVAALPDAWDRVAGGAAVLASEQMARRFGLAPGDRLTLPTPAGGWEVELAAIHRDFGNPVGQVMVASDAFARHWPEGDRRRMGLRVAPGAVPALAAALAARFGLGEEQIVDQRGRKEFSLRIFEKTFAITIALNALTLLVAGVALLTSLLTLADLRLVQLAPLWALGLTRAQLAWLEMGKMLGLAALTACAALPLGLAVAWVLTAVVNVRAFGWRLPVEFLPGQWGTLFLLALLCAFVAALWPIWRLRRASPLTLLQSFSNER
ncbi:ABC transporter permease [Amaricoccus sp.]|mgnify:FL=1|uniref:ABC transporter permease n=1 Tax=Amaricoccus sp. TaxID=1872485 RepID=UPI002C5BBB10|nr:ABC transporter permease [Amaricoccus sp.]HRW14766.1 ABC transporter permease [Amaricoccus sp.]